MTDSSGFGARHAYVVWEPNREGDGTTTRWGREIYGVNYWFDFVRMPDGELRWFVRKFLPDPRDHIRTVIPDAGKWVRHAEMTRTAEGTWRRKHFDYN